jgi:two-component system, OmpR family, sensor histidine kinase VicK
MKADPDRSAERLAAIVESSDDAIVSKDLRGYITSWNSAAERMFGYTAAEIVGRHITTIIPIARRGEEDYVLGRIHAGLRTEHFETVRCRKDGTLVDVSLTISPIRASDGTVIGASKIARDITERRARERDLFRLAAIVESSDDAIVSKDLNSIILTWNAAAEQIFGYTADEAIGRHIGLIIPDDRQDEETLVMSQIRAQNSVRHFDTVRRRKDGTLIDISLTVSPIRSASGEVIGASKIARDITEDKALRRAASEAARVRDEFLATLSHELRTPLNTLLGYTHMIQAGTIEGPAARKALEAMARNGEALAALVNDVLDASRFVTGKMRLELQPTDLGPVLEEAIDTVRPAMLAKSIALDVSIAQDLLVNADRDRMRQVMWNLLSNAVKFTPAGSIALRAWRERNTVRIEVRDTGIGIEAEALPRVFERFFQADATHTRRHSGLGLGLALVHYIVELHGGRVTAHSEGLGRGACFEIDLPALRAG